MGNMPMRQSGLNIDPRAMTEEIERITSADRGVSGTESPRVPVASMPGVQAQQLGGAAIFGTPEMVPGGVPEVANAAEVGAAAAELQRDRDELVDPVAYVGEETPFLVEERLQEDREDLMVQNGEGDPLTVKVTARNQESLGRAAAFKASKFINRRDGYRVSDLLRMHGDMSREALGLLGRGIGGRN